MRKKCLCESLFVINLSIFLYKYFKDFWKSYENVYDFYKPNFNLFQVYQDIY